MYPLLQCCSNLYTHTYVSVLFQELPTYNEKRRTPTISTLNTLKRTRSNPSLNMLFGTDSQSASPVLSHDSSLRHFQNGSWNEFDNMSISSGGSFVGKFTRLVCT